MKAKATKEEGNSYQKSVNYFFENYDWPLNDISVTLTSIHNYVLNEKQKELVSEIIDEYNKRVKKCVTEEEYQLRDRKSILDFLASYICGPSMEPGEVGYLLAPKEILDFILGKGNK